jgi:hypothetical protein
LTLFPHCRNSNMLLETRRGESPRVDAVEYESLFEPVPVMLTPLVRPICDDIEIKFLDATLPDLRNILILEEGTPSEELPARFQSR